jgi:hypothetical protein
LVLGKPACPGVGLKPLRNIDSSNVRGKGWRSKMEGWISPVNFDRPPEWRVAVPRLSHNMDLSVWFLAAKLRLRKDDMSRQLT